MYLTFFACVCTSSSISREEAPRFLIQLGSAIIGAEGLVCLFVCPLICNRQTSDFKTSLIWTIHFNKQQPNVNQKKKSNLIFFWYSDIFLKCILIHENTCHTKQLSDWNMHVQLYLEINIWAFSYQDLSYVSGIFFGVEGTTWVFLFRSFNAIYTWYEWVYYTCTYSFQDGSGGHFLVSIYMYVPTGARFNIHL